MAMTIMAWAKETGKASSDFIEEQVTMSSVYDYMSHLMNEYAKLLRSQEQWRSALSSWLALQIESGEGLSSRRTMEFIVFVS